MNKEINEEKVIESVEKVNAIVEKVSLICKRVILGVIIFVLLIFIGIDGMLIKQTIKAKDFIDTTATYVSEKEEQEDSEFVDYIYTFEDKKGEQQEITISRVKDSVPEQELKIKYNENDPQDFYEEGSTLDKSGMIWFGVKIVVVILLILLFFNKKLLSKISLSVSRN